MAGGPAPRSTRIAVWVGAAAAAAICAFSLAAVLRGNDPAEQACAESGGVWNFEERVCEAPHGAEAEGR